MVVLNSDKSIETELKKTEEIIDDIQEQIQNMYDDLDQLLANWLPLAINISGSLLTEHPKLCE